MNTYASVAYIYLDPDVDNPCQSFAHKALERRLNEHFPEWEGFHKANPNFNLGFVVGMNLGIAKLEVKGPTKFKGMQTVDYSIFLPTWVRDLDCSKASDVETYITLFVNGVERCMEKYKVPASEFSSLHSELLLDLVSELEQRPA